MRRAPTLADRAQRIPLRPGPLRGAQDLAHGSEMVLHATPAVRQSARVALAQWALRQDAPERWLAEMLAILGLDRRSEV